MPPLLVEIRLLKVLYYWVEESWDDVSLLLVGDAGAGVDEGFGVVVGSVVDFEAVTITVKV